MNSSSYITYHALSDSRNLALDRFLTLILLLASGNPVVTQYAPRATLVGLAIVFVTYAVLRGKRPSGSATAVIAFFAAVSAVHLWAFGIDTLTASIGFAIRLVIALCTILAINSFPYRYVEAMFVLSLISLTLYLADNLGLNLRVHLGWLAFPIAQSDAVHIGIHNFHSIEDAYRNSGLFWEPGAYAGYLILAIVFLAALRGNLSNAHYVLYFAVLLAALISTFSTMGYATLPLLLLLHLPKRTMRLSKGLWATIGAGSAVLALVLAVFLTQELEFLGEKIIQQLEQAVDQGGMWQVNRFGNAVFDIGYITERPLLGWSPLPGTRAGLDPAIEELLAGQGNGLTGFAVRFGLIGLAVILIAYYLALRTMLASSINAAIATLVLCGALFGEQFLNFPIYLTLLFLQRNSTEFVQRRDYAAA